MCLSHPLHIVQSVGIVAISCELALSRCAKAIASFTKMLCYVSAAAVLHSAARKVEQGS